jgi:hypothetical protein
MNKGTTYKGIVKCIQKESDIEHILNICRGARVQICGKIFEPDWGLYNGAIGHVVEIIYQKDTGPLDGSLPEYVVVGPLNTEALHGFQKSHLGFLYHH